MQSTSKPRKTKQNIMLTTEHLERTSFCPGDLIKARDAFGELFPAQMTGECCGIFSAGDVAMVIAVKYDKQVLKINGETSTDIADLFVIMSSGMGWIRRESVKELLEGFTVIFEVNHEGDHAVL